MILFAVTLFLLIALANVLWWPGVRRPGITAGTVSILIPARNEEANLPECLTAALVTNADAVLVYDDHSEDATASIVERFAASDSRVRLIEPRPLPTGWAGKPFACSVLASEANTDWILFLDADARVTPEITTRMVSEAIARHATLISCWPRIEMLSFAERVLMPMLNFVVFSIFPGPLSLFRAEPSLALAHGACILAHRQTYARLGGHALVRNEIFEDTRLAQIWREKREYSLGVDGQDVVRVRMYDSVTGIWQGFSKNFYPAFRHWYSFFAFLFVHAAVFLAPFLFGWWIPAFLVLVTRAVIALRFRHSLWSVLLHPFAEMFVLALGLASFWRCATGRGVAWKGRVYRTT